MEFKRNGVITLDLAGRLQMAIVRVLQHLHVNKSFISRTIARYNDTKNDKTVTTPKMIRKVKARFDRNPHRSGGKIKNKRK